MKRLYKGILKFQESYFKKERKFFRRLSNKQDPDVLFITCADARVYPTLVTQSKPGELFIVRNVGNIVPPHDSIKDKNSVAAAIEFAVLKLKVSDIIVCGHSNCGAMQRLPEMSMTCQPCPTSGTAACGIAGQGCCRQVLCREFRASHVKGIGRGKCPYSVEKTYRPIRSYQRHWRKDSFFCTDGIMRSFRARFTSMIRIRIYSRTSSFMNEKMPEALTAAARYPL